MLSQFPFSSLSLDSGLISFSKKSRGFCNEVHPRIPVLPNLISCFSANAACGLCGLNGQCDLHHHTVSSLPELLNNQQHPASLSFTSQKMTFIHLYPSIYNITMNTCHIIVTWLFLYSVIEMVLHLLILSSKWLVLELHLVAYKMTILQQNTHNLNCFKWIHYCTNLSPCRPTELTYLQSHLQETSHLALLELSPN